MPWHTPERKSEQALKLYLETVLGYEISGVQVATRFSNVPLTEPRIEIVVEKCSPHPEDAQYYTGSWTVSGTIKVVSHYETSVDAEAHDNILGVILDNLIIVDENGNDAAVSEINATQNEEAFTVQLFNLGERTNDIEDHSLVSVQSFSMLINVS